MTDYDSWRTECEVVTASQVTQTLKSNSDSAKRVAATILEDLHEAVLQGDIVSEEGGSMKNSIMPSHARLPDEDAKKLAFILPDYFHLTKDTN